MGYRGRSHLFGVKDLKCKFAVFHSLGVSHTHFTIYTFLWSVLIADLVMEKHQITDQIGGGGGGGGGGGRGGGLRLY